MGKRVILINDLDDFNLDHNVPLDYSGDIIVSRIHIIINGTGQQSRWSVLSISANQAFTDSLQNCTGPSQAEILLRTTSHIASSLIKAHESNTTISLNVLRAQASKKYGFGGVPRLVDIISAIPDEWRKVLLPRLKARPVRTASGVSALCICISGPDFDLQLVGRLRL